MYLKILATFVVAVSEMHTESAENERRQKERVVKRIIGFRYGQMNH